MRCTLLFFSFLFLNGLSAQTGTLFNTINSPLTYDQTSVLLVDESRLWVGTNYGLNLFENETWTNFLPTNSDLEDTQIRSLAINQNGDLLVGTFQNGLFIYDGSTWLNFNTSNSGIEDNFIRALAVENDNSYWIGTSGGLYLYDGTWTKFDMNNSNLMSDNIASLKLGQNDTLYIGTINGGLSEIDINSFGMNTYTLSNSLINDNTILDIQIDAQGNKILSAPAGGLMNFSNGIWSAFTVVNSPITSNSINATALVNNQFFVAHQDEGLDLIPNWLNYNTTNSILPEDNLSDLALQGDSILWIGTASQGLVKMELDFLNSSSSPQSIPGLEIYPNPASTFVQINRSPINWILYNSLGQIVGFGQEKSGSISVDSYPTGLYLLEIKYKEQQESQKLFIGPKN